MLNKVNLIGNIVTDIKLKIANNGKEYLPFILSIPRYTPKGMVERKPWMIDCIAWQTVAKTIERYVRKGQKVCICGHLTREDYYDCEDTRFSKMQVYVEEVILLSYTKKRTSEDDEDE